LSIERPFTITVTDVPEVLSTSSDSYTTAAGKALTVPAPGVLQNDVDPAGRPLTAIKASDPQHGSLTLNANGSFTYTPVPGFAGVDGFTYRASNGDEPSQPITVTITVLPTLSITGGEVQEGNTGTRPGRLTVTLSNPSSQPVSVRVTSANGTASEGQDYQRLQTTVAFAPGETSKPVDVQVIGDTADEAAETVSVGLSVPTNAALGVEVATLTIVDDDGPALGAQADHCTPRPAIQVRTRQVGPGVLEVTISDQDGQIGTTGGMLLVRLQPDASSVVDLAPGMSSTYPQGGTGLTGALAMKPARPEQDFVFTIRRTGSGPFTVGVTVNDSCGEWKTFAGGGQGI
jgi:VCBS repeat-containing protein